MSVKPIWQYLFDPTPGSWMYTWMCEGCGVVREDDLREMPSHSLLDSLCDSCKAAQMLRVAKIMAVVTPIQDWREFEHAEAVRTGVDRMHLTENDFVPYEYHGT